MEADRGGGGADPESSPLLCRTAAEAAQTGEPQESALLCWGLVVTNPGCVVT